ACRILKIKSCLRSPLAPGSSKDRAILVSSVMFFSLSSAMVIFTYVDFLREGFSFPGRGWIALPPCGHTAELLKQLAVVLRQSSQVRSGRHDVPHRRFCQKHHSWFLGYGCSAYEICAWPSRPAGKAYTDSAGYGARQKRDQNACSVFLLQKKSFRR